ncbi:MAG: DUF2304 family protein [Flavisolibacter sp.]
MITIIQAILATGILLLGAYSYVKFRSSHVDALLIFLFALSGLVFTFFPDLANRLAHLLGVGRGADMVFYLCILFFFFLIIKLYAKVRKLEQALTNWSGKKAWRRPGKGLEVHMRENNRV